MWDNTALLRNIANALLAFSVLAALYGAAYYIAHLPGLLPLHSVRLSAVPQRVISGDVLQAVRSEVNGNFFTVDIGRLRQSLEKLPWVRSVAIRRELPDRLAVHLEEHQALARWNGAALVNTYGEVFSADTGQVLPDFMGQTGDSGEVAQRYGDFSRQLAALDLQVVQLALSPRHAWQLRLSNGTVLELGRKQMQQRLARFVAVQKTDDITSDLAGVVCQPSRMASCSIRRQMTEGAVKYVDLRYRNGFAVRRMVEDGKLGAES